MYVVGKYVCMYVCMYVCNVCVLETIVSTMYVWGKIISGEGKVRLGFQVKKLCPHEKVG